MLKYQRIFTKSSGLPSQEGYLTKRYRDAVAHFVLKDGTTLNVSDLRLIDKYVNILPIVESCCRKAIGTLEHFLSQNSLAVG